MLIAKEKKFIKTHFNNEAEIEKVVIDNYEYLFGPNSIYLPKALIKTSDGAGTIPDGFAIDIAQKKWYLVEAELVHHSLWSHIAPQITKQLLAINQTSTKKVIEELAVQLYQTSNTTQEKFSEMGIAEINVRKVVGEILENDPVIGIPIDDVSNDLKDWARTLRFNVKLWIIRKFVDFHDSSNIIFEFPEEFKPELDTEEESEVRPVNKEIAKYDVDLIDLMNNGLLKAGDKLYMQYKPKSGLQKKYNAVVLNDGTLEVLGKVYSSPSYAALAGIQDAGSDRETVNGWTSWKNEHGRSLVDLREKFLSMSDEKSSV